MPGTYDNPTEIALQGSLFADTQPTLEQTISAAPAAKGELSNPELLTAAPAAMNQPAPTTAKWIRNSSRPCRHHEELKTADPKRVLVKEIDDDL